MLHNNAASQRIEGCAKYTKAQRRNAQSDGQNNAELSDSVFPSAEVLQGMNSRDESDTVNARGVEKGMGTREKPDKLIEKARRLERRRHGNNPSI